MSDRSTPVAVPARLVTTAPIPARNVAPFVARPVGAAHPRRRLDRGLVLGAGPEPTERDQMAQLPSPSA